MVLDPARTQGLADPVVALYQRAEIYLIRCIRDALIRTGEAPSWAEAQLLMIRQERGNVEGMADALHRRLGTTWRDSIETAYLRGQIEAEKELATIPDSVLDTRPIPQALNTDAVYALTAEAIGIMTPVHQGILRRTEDIWRSIVAEATGYSVTGSMTTYQAAKNAFTRMAREGLPYFQDRRGRKWGLDTYAEMAVRTATNKALIAGHTDTMVQNGIDLVVVSSHKNPAPQCAPYERKVLSLTGKFAPGTHRIGDSIVNVKATMQDAEASGLHHPNCRHTHSAYIPGYTRVSDAPYDGDDTGYKATQKQRYYERQIRASKRMEEAAIDERDARAARQRTKAYQAKLRDHIEEYDLPRRRHREQVRKPDNGRLSIKFDIPKQTTPKPKPVSSGGRRHRRDGDGRVSVADILAKNKVDNKLTRADNKRTRAEEEKAYRRAHRLDYVDVEDMPKAVFKESAGGKTLAGIPKTNRTGWDIIKKEANPRYGTDDSYGVNCVRVANAVELRRRGYDVQAGPTGFRPDSAANWGVCSKTRLVFNDLTDEKLKFQPSTTDVAINAWETTDGKNRVFMQADKAVPGVSGGVNGATVKMFEDAMPDGASGFATTQWKKRDVGHIWNWVKEDGKIRFFEAQSKKGFIDNAMYLKMARNGSLKMVRVDDLVPTDDVLKVINITEAGEV